MASAMAETIVPVAGKRRLAPLLISAAIAFVILCGFGTWQLQRLAWKTDLIATVETRIAMTPVVAPAPGDWPALDFAETTGTQSAQLAICPGIFASHASPPTSSL